MNNILSWRFLFMKTPHKHELSYLCAMKNKLIAISALLATAIFLVSCEKEVDLQLDPGEQKLVVNASIQRIIDPYTGQEDGQPPIVILTKSISFFGDLDSTALADYFIHDATVSISNGTRTAQLIEYSLTGIPGFDLDAAYFYSLDTSGGLQNLLLGEFNTDYELTIEWEGETYTATTRLNQPVPIDSLWTQVANVPQSDTTFYEIRGQYTDPPGKGQNYYYRSNSFFPSGEGGNYDDYFNDEIADDISLKFSFFSDQGEDNIERYGYWLPGDSLMVEWSAIDYPAYEFYNTKNFSTNSIGNPFATPVNVIGNISNDALGAFIGYGTYIYQYKVQ